MDGSTSAILVLILLLLYECCDSYLLLSCIIRPIVPTTLPGRMGSGKEGLGDRHECEDMAQL